jgi:hypothetical protein
MSDERHSGPCQNRTFSGETRVGATCVARNSRVCTAGQFNGMYGRLVRFSRERLTGRAEHADGVA